MKSSIISHGFSLTYQQQNLTTPVTYIHSQATLLPRYGLFNNKQ